LDAEPGGMPDHPVSPELVLVDPELRLAVAELPSAPTIQPPRRIVPLAEPLRPPRPLPLPLAATAYAAVVFGRMMVAGLALAALLVVLVVVAVLLR